LKCLGLLLPFIIGLFFFGCRQVPIGQKEQDYDIENLSSLTNYHAEDHVGQAFNSRYLLFIYLDDSSCSQCVNRDLEYLEALFREQGHNVEMLMVVYDPLENQKRGKGPFLRSLVRAGRVAYPILLEKTRGESGLGPGFNISLFDQKRSVLAMRYFPKLSEDHWLLFQRLMKNRIGK